MQGIIGNFLEWVLKTLDRIVTVFCKIVLWGWLVFMCWLLTAGLWALATSWWGAMFG